jgi:DNA-binding PadR family transcriptional regulator
MHHHTREHGPEGHLHGHDHFRGRGRGDIGFGRGGWGGGRRRMRRGDIRTAILLALQDGPGHGYEIIGRLEERSGGLWRPSPGSVYPTLQLLEDERLVTSDLHEGTRTYELTEAGLQAGAEAAAARRGRAPWESGDEGDEAIHALRQAVGQTAAAAKQVAQAGSPEQVARSTEIVQRARKELYQILAES